jgi:hypothetical protein
MINNFIDDDIYMRPNYKQQFKDYIDKRFLIGTNMSIVANLVIGVAFFVISVYLDSRKQVAYRY